MEKKNRKNGEKLPAELIRVKEEIENDRFLRIKERFELNKSNVAASVSHDPDPLDFPQPYVKDNKRKDNNMLAFRMNIPLQYFNGISSDSIKEIEQDDKPDTHELPSVELPNVERLPPFVTWTFTNRNQLMAESNSMIGKKLIYYVDGEVEELDSDEGSGEEEEDKEKNEKEKFDFSKDADRFIWKIMEKYGLDDEDVLSAVARFLKLDVSDILERYNDLKMLKNTENIGEASISGSKSITSSLLDNIDRHFCRRCLVFGCQMHEKSMPIKYRENKTFFQENEATKELCRSHCYLKQRGVTEEIKYDKVVSYDWTPEEKDLYMQGVEAFGKNSCLITRNLLSGLKSCVQVYNYMHQQDQSTMFSKHNQTSEIGNQINKAIPGKSTTVVKRKLQKQCCYPPALRKQTKGGNLKYKQYTPCTCEPVCGDQCTCLSKGNCCEKYCGCTKICKNRFGGCNCAKGQCGNRQCPCYAANRECDPDVCKSCWFSCGDGSLGETSEDSQCKNLKFLRNQQKKILLAKSDVQGWGAFTRHSVKKNEFLGEYIGELISHEEGNERGRVDGELGYSYLFNLNDQFEIDARYMGNKFRFLNHSPQPNCSAKLKIVKGDQRIGIYSSKAIEEGEELFFDYCYGPGHQPWSRSRQPRKIGSSKKSKNIKP